MSDGKRRIGESSTSPRRIDANEKRVRAVELRKAGATYDQIAGQVGYSSRASAYRAIKKALDDAVSEPAKELVSMELERLDALQLGVWQQARTGHLGSIDRVLKIMERRARLLGLDESVETEISVVPHPSERSTKLDSMLREYLQQRGTNTSNDRDDSDSD